MKKKFYFPDNIGIIIGCAFFLILAILPLVELIKILFVTFSYISKASIEDTIVRFLIAIIMIVPVLFFGYTISHYLCYTIILDKVKIYIHEDTNIKKKKIQYYTCANYENIYSVDIIWSNRKSNGEKSDINSIAGTEKIPYLRINTKDGKQKLFMIMFTSKRTVKKIILELKKRAEMNDNEIIMEDIESIINSFKKCE